MSEEQPKNPLHGVTLKVIVEQLVEARGWDDLASRVKIKCFSHEPSVKSSLKFLRRTPWAREQVERLYLRDQEIARRKANRAERNRKRNKKRAANRALKAAAEAQAVDAPDAGSATPVDLPAAEPGADRLE